MMIKFGDASNHAALYHQQIQPPWWEEGVALKALEQILDLGGATIAHPHHEFTYDNTTAGS